MLQLTPAARTMIRDARLARKPKAERKLGEVREKALVAAIANIMRHSEPTVFAFEATCRHCIRSALCLQGWSWRAADTVAAEAVAAALRQLGARRPTWAQGQPSWTEEGVLRHQRDFCIRCRKPIPMERILRSTGIPPKYCDIICTRAAAEAMYRQSLSEEQAARHKARDAAYKQAKRNAMPLAACEYCGATFRPRPPKPSKPASRFCSLQCSNRGRAGTQARPCLEPRGQW